MSPAQGGVKLGLVDVPLTTQLLAQRKSREEDPWSSQAATSGTVAERLVDRRLITVEPYSSSLPFDRKIALNAVSTCDPGGARRDTTPPVFAVQGSEFAPASSKGQKNKNKTNHVMFDSDAPVHAVLPTSAIEVGKVTLWPAWGSTPPTQFSLFSLRTDWREATKA